jgi:glycine cleavage system H protein
VYVALPAVGSVLTGGQPCGEVESTKSVSDLFAPLDGTVIEVNTALEDSPEMVNAEPYGEGWMVDVECASAEEADAAWSLLLSAGQYADGLS